MDNRPFTLTTVNDFTLTVDPGKKLDNSNAYEMVETLTESLSRGYKFVIIDMKQLEFISSAGVGSILGSVEIFRADGGDIILCNASEEILHVFNVLDLAEYLTVKNTAEEAASFCQSGKSS